MYNWQDFDQTTVNALAQKRLRDENGMTCPLVAHERERLSWRESGRPRSGTEMHGEPAASFRASPTYILQDPLQNFIIGKEMVSEAIKGAWDKVETSRLGHEDSEDAVSWNVFRSLQETGLLHSAACLLAGVDADIEPDLYLWGRHIMLTKTAAWPKLQEIRKKLEGDGYNTEPDICLHVKGWGWIFIEAKFGGRTTICRNDDHLKQWKQRYPIYGADVFNLEEMNDAVREDLPEQLLRNVLFAHLMRSSDEKAIVIALCRECDGSRAKKLDRFLPDNAPVPIRPAYWEQIYRDITPDVPVLAPLRTYYERKSLRLGQAFNVKDSKETD